MVFVWMKLELSKLCAMLPNQNRYCRQFNPEIQIVLVCIGCRCWESTASDGQLRTNLVGETLGPCGAWATNPRCSSDEGALFCAASDDGGLVVCPFPSIGRPAAVGEPLHRRCEGFLSLRRIKLTSRIRITKLPFWTTNYLFLRSAVKDNYDGRNLWFLSSTVTNLLKQFSFHGHGFRQLFFFLSTCLSAGAVHISARFSNNL